MNRHSIRWRLLITMVILVMAVLTTLTYMQIWSQKHILQKELTHREVLMREKTLQRGQILRDNLANQVAIEIAAFNFSLITESIHEVVKKDQDLVYGILMDVEQIAHVHTLKPKLELEILSKPADLFALSQHQPTQQTLQQNGAEIVEFITPIQISTQPWGVLRLGFSMANVAAEIKQANQELNKQIQWMIIKSIITAVIFLLIGFIFVYMIATRISKPLVDLTNSARELATGNFAAKVPLYDINEGCEIGMLATAFTDMAKDLESTYLKLEKYNTSLEQLVEERTVQLKRKNELIRQMFGRYLSDEIVDALLETETGLALGGERREITILTSDLRGFTARSNKLPPEKVINILNLYLAAMADVIAEHHGIINEFLGDGILVFFGAPIARENDPERAVACAIAMQLAMNAVNEDLRLRGIPPLAMGIGINTGDVIVGNIGSEKRTHYSAIGHNVNLTYRIESYTVGGQVFISEATFQKVEEIVTIWSEKTVNPKGIKQAVNIYEVGGIGGKYNLYLHKEPEKFFQLRKEVPLLYAILEEKHVDAQQFRGTLLKLSTNGALIHCEAKKDLLPKPLENIRINLVMLQNSSITSEDIYAKVLTQEIDGRSLSVNFTSISVDLRAYLVALIAERK